MTIYNNLQAVKKDIAAIRERRINSAIEIVQGKAIEVADAQSKQAGDEVFDAVQEQKRAQKEAAKKTRDNERNIRRKYIKPELPQQTIDDIVKYKFIGGYSVSQLMEKFKQDDTNRIFQAVQRGVVEGTTLKDVMQSVQESALDVSRESARTVARTVINGVANNTRMEMYRQNADVLDGVQFLATLDSRTCPVCGAYDGKIWKPDKMDEAPSLPLHPNCRCVLIPYIDTGEEFEGERAAEAENFDKMAEEAYKANPKAKKDWDDLSPEYRQHLRYNAIKKWERDNPGKEAYRQVSGNTTFQDYFDKQTPEFQREWLGPKRYELWKEGKIKNVDQLVNPDTGYKRTLEDLGVKKEKIEQSSFTPPTAEEFLIESGKIADERNVELETEQQSIITQITTLADDAQVFYKRYMNNEVTFAEKQQWLEETKKKKSLLETALAKVSDKLDEWTYGRKVKQIQLIFPVRNAETSKSGKEQFEKAAEDIHKAAKRAAGVMGQIQESAGIKPTQDIPEFVKIKSKDSTTGEYSFVENRINIAVTHKGKSRSFMEILKTSGHEIGHYFEENDDKLQQRVVKFFDSIKVGNPLTVIKNKSGDVEYWYYTANIPMPNNYVMKTYAPKGKELRTEWQQNGKWDTFSDKKKEYYKENGVFDTSTELTSMFFGNFLANPEQFARDYPQFFNGMVKVIYGIR